MQSRDGLAGLTSKAYSELIAMRGISNAAQPKRDQKAHPVRSGSIVPPLRTSSVSVHSRPEHVTSLRFMTNVLHQDMDDGWLRPVAVT